MKTREIATVSVFASLWIGAQITLGPVIGRFTIGPFNMHGIINHIVGWLLIVLTFIVIGRFGAATMMALVAAIGTRFIRANTIEGILAGIGYVLGALVFDVLIYSRSPISLALPRGRLYILVLAGVTGAVTQVPYLLFKLFLVGPTAFLGFTPLYAYWIVKGTLFSIIGSGLGIYIAPRVETLVPAKNRLIIYKTIKSHRSESQAKPSTDQT